MSRRAATRGFGVIPGFFVIAALLAGILLVGTANPAPAATAGPCAAHLTTVSRSVASASPSPGASSGPATTPASSTPATPTPSPTTTPATSPPPTPTTSPSATPTTSPSPSPRSSSTSPAPKAHLCLTVQSLTASVRAGGQARYAIWAWLAGGSRGTAKIKIAAKPGGLAPSFTVCARPGGNMCSVGLTSKAVQLRAAVAAPRKAAGTRITLRATGPHRKRQPPRPPRTASWSRRSQRPQPHRPGQPLRPAWACCCRSETCPRECFPAPGCPCCQARSMTPPWPSRWSHHRRQRPRPRRRSPSESPTCQHRSRWKRALSAARSSAWRCWPRPLPSPSPASRSAGNSRNRAGTPTDGTCNYLVGRIVGEPTAPAGCPASFAWLVGPALSGVAPPFRRGAGQGGMQRAFVRPLLRDPPCDSGTPSRPPSVGEWRRNSRTNDGQKFKDPTAVDSDQALDLLLR